MSRATSTDRDRALRRLSVVTGGVTAASVALTGALMVVAKHETETKKAAKAQQQRQARVVLSNQTSPAGDPAGSGPATGPGRPAEPAQSAPQSTTVHVYRSPAARSPTKTSAKKKPKKAKTATRTTTADRAATPSRTPDPAATDSRPQVPVQASMQAPVQAPVQDPAQVQSSAQAPAPVQSSGS